MPVKQIIYPNMFQENYHLADRQEYQMVKENENQIAIISEDKVIAEIVLCSDDEMLVMTLETYDWGKFFMLEITEDGYVSVHPCEWNNVGAFFTQTA